MRRGPVLHARRCAKDGRPNINGPAALAAPSWLPGRLANYYLYFSQHRGDGIWLAVSERVEGPWRELPAPVLTLAATGYTDHVASPDVVVDEERAEVRMYFHGGDGTELAQQRQCVAVSRDGVAFHVVSRDIGTPYWRVFKHAGWWHALVMPGALLRSRDGLRDFEAGGALLPATVRHSAILVRGSHASIFYSELGACPEAIAMREAEMGEWGRWRVGEARVILRPDEGFEGGRLAARPAEAGQALEPARELRDPAVLLVDGSVHLFYVAGGERCIALASGELAP